MNIQEDETTRTIIGRAMSVHNELGNGFQEVIYQRALAIAFFEYHLQFNREQEMEIYYHEHLIGTRRVDFLVENSIMVEIKAVSVLDDVHLAQTKNYLEAYGLRTGLLINFGGNKLEFKRIFNNKIKKRPIRTNDSDSKNPIHPEHPVNPGSNA